MRQSKVLPPGRLVLAICVLLSACDTTEVPVGPSTAARGTTTTLTVTATMPDSTARDTTIAVQVTGTGFERGAVVSFARNGVTDPKLQVNSTKFVKSTSLVANVTIAADATPDAYDVVVTLAAGKKGIGTELFTVLPINIVAGATVFYAANDGGQAVGVGCDAKGNNCRPIAWSTGPVSYLPMPAGSCGGRASAINGAGIIAGRVSDCTVSAPMRWVPSGTGSYSRQALGTVAGATNYFLFDITDQGVIVGSAYDPAANRFNAVLWDPAGAPHLLSSPLAVTGTSEAMGINESGLIAGYVRRTGGYQPVVWLPDGSAAQLQIPDTADYGFADAINESGVVVGNVGWPGGYRAVIWRPDPAQANAWLPPVYLSTTANAEAWAINNADQVVGQMNGLPYYWDATRGPVPLAVASNQWSGIGYAITNSIAAAPRIFGRSKPPSNTPNSAGVWWPVP